jgi:hypothetical protein
MCADVAIHDPYPLGHNPHAHIMLTVRPLDEHGKWQYKTEKEYLCVRNGEERGLTSAEFKAAQAEGWEKQYQYKVGRKKVYMTPTAAEAQGYERVSKHPKSTKYGRQNPISLRWNSDEQLILWRESWAEAVNQSLERNGRDERIDHRSHAARGLDEQPTVHEGVIARALERQGIVSDRCELNRQIKADNALLRELKAQVKKLAQSVQNTVPALAEALESLRAKMIVFRYQFRRIDVSKQQRTNHLKSLKTFLGSYTKLVQQIKDKSAQRKALQAEKKATSVLHIPKQRDLNRRITELTEDLEELRSEKTLLLQRLDDDDTNISSVNKDITTLESGLKKLEQQETRYFAELDDALKQYKQLHDQAVEFDPQELMDARLALRPVKEQGAAEQVQKAYGDQYSFTTMNNSKHDVSTMLGEAAEMWSLWERQRRIQREKERQEREQRRKSKNRGYER